ncbi:Methyltransferase domain protein [Caulifigura coniformis]|uniref:Methyltransferase domain protein n=1 Tax=Caulifigura coniformis TaxID=2527983 RepID=A0A517SI79_9PLAN|nr:FkbM family methyltransferase [Caulifigura coniformis]QDT55831.1 Methyltransferase domain protein [Caulifigura coniformis]
MLRRLIEVAKLSKNPRVGPRNAIRLDQLQAGGKEVILRPTSFYKELHLRPNHGDWLVFEQIFINLAYGAILPHRPVRIVDAGANIGLASVYFAQQLGECEIVAIEPESENFAAACRNTRPYPQVTMMQAAVWPHSEPVEISNAAEAGSLGFQVQSVSDRGKSAMAVEGVSISEIMQRRGWPAIDLVKMDIEGAEKEIFEDEGCLHWLERTRVLVIELHDWFRPGCGDAFLRTMSRMGDLSVSVAHENVIVVNNRVKQS